MNSASPRSSAAHNEAARHQSDFGEVTRRQFEHPRGSSSGPDGRHTHSNELPAAAATPPPLILPLARKGWTGTHPAPVAQDDVPQNAEAVRSASDARHGRHAPPGVATPGGRPSLGWIAQRRPRCRVPAGGRQRAAVYADLSRISSRPVSIAWATCCASVWPNRADSSGAVTKSPASPNFLAPAM